MKKALYGLFFVMVLSGCMKENETPKNIANVNAPVINAGGTPVSTPTFAVNSNQISNAGNTRTENANRANRKDRDDRDENRRANRESREKNEREEDERER